MVKLKGLHVVTGAFGYTGRWIAHHLLEKGANVRTLTNSIGRDDPFDGKIEVHRYDFDDRKKLVESLKGVSVLYNTYWVRYTVEGQGFAHALAVKNSKKLFLAAKEAGVGKIVHISVANPQKAPDWAYFRGKIIVEDFLKKTGVPHSIVRPTLLYLRINEPEEDLYNNRVNINVKSSDPDGIEKVQYRIDNGTWRDLSSDGNDIFIETWTPTWDGWHWLDIRTVDNQEYETFQGIRFETDSTPPSLILNSLTNDITAIAEFDLQVYDYSNLQSIKYRIKPYGTIWQDWTELEQNGEQIVFSWDSTKYEDGECLLEIECTDEWGGVSTLYRNLDVKNQGLVYSIPPTNIETNTVTKITSIVDYENPVDVNMIVAKIDEDVLAEGQKIPMKKEGNYYIGELFFESSGNYVYSIEVDTGHGKLTSYEQNIIVSDKQIVSSSGEENNALVSTNIIPVIFILIIIVIRRK